MKYDVVAMASLDEPQTRCNPKVRTGNAHSVPNISI